MNLENYLKKQISQQGPISVAEFMQLALMHPEYGYYQQQQPFGKEGDFITAPEISQMFGEMVGIWLVSMWQQLGEPKGIQLVELGPGRGVLMEDILRATKHVTSFHESLSIVMVEQSTSLQQLQLKRLSRFHKKIRWQQIIEGIDKKPTLCVANEFFDALPIYQYVKTKQGLCERLIGLEDEKLAFVLGARGAKTRAAESLVQNINEGDIVEASPASTAIMTSIASHIKQYGGAGLFVDYGYEAPAEGDTLQAVKQHQYHPVLDDVGKADITAHVNFTALADAAKQSGLNQQQIITQSEFLSQMGISERAMMLKKNASKQQQEVINRALHRLMDPSEMGSLFKVLMIA